jgi:hypothetical protein
MKQCMTAPKLPVKAFIPQLWESEHPQGWTPNGELKALFLPFLSIDKNRRQNSINLLTGVGSARAQASDARVAGEEVNEIDRNQTEKRRVRR